MHHITVMVRLLLVSLSLLSVIGCAPMEYDTSIPTPTGDTQFIGGTDTIRPLIRLVDREAGTVCYIPYSGRAIFCFPLDSTKLK